MDNDWIVKIIESPGRFDLELWVYRRALNGGTEVWYGDSTETFAYGADIKKPSLILSPGMLKALQQALSEKGIRPDHETFALGKLEATEEHLADLRHLLKLPLEYVVNKRV
jgi:hypothetical protein